MEGSRGVHVHVRTYASHVWTVVARCSNEMRWVRWHMIAAATAVMDAGKPCLAPSCCVDVLLRDQYFLALSLKGRSRYTIPGRKGGESTTDREAEGEPLQMPASCSSRGADQLKDLGVNPTSHGRWMHLVLSMESSTLNPRGY